MPVPRRQRNRAQASRNEDYGGEVVASEMLASEPSVEQHVGRRVDTGAEHLRRSEQWAPAIGFIGGLVPTLWFYGVLPVRAAWLVSSLLVWTQSLPDAGGICPVFALPPNSRGAHKPSAHGLISAERWRERSVDREIGNGACRVQTSHCRSSRAGCGKALETGEPCTPTF